MAANIRLLRRRIKTAKNIAQITKAMEMVAASKMRKAQERALAGKPYTEKLNYLVGSLVNKLGEEKHPYLVEKPRGKTLIVLFSTDKGLAGSLNTNLLREYLTFSKNRDDIEVIAVGKKLQKIIVRSGGVLTADFPFGATLPSFDAILPIVSMIVDGYKKGEYKKIYCLYAKFVSVSTQKPFIHQILPAAPQKEEEEANVEYKFEPNVKDLLTSLMPHYLETTMYQIFLESYASEQAARMMAMHQASENAKDVIWELSLVYNKARQERITNELLDITGASMGVVA